MDLNGMKNLKGKKKMKDHDFKNPRKSLNSFPFDFVYFPFKLNFAGFERKGGGGRWGYGEVVVLLPLVLMCFALKRKDPKLERE